MVDRLFKIMNILFLMDPLESIKKDKDTSFMLMVGARRRGHRTFFLPGNGMQFRQGRLFFHVTDVEPVIDGKDAFKKNESLILSQDDVDVIFIRTDPPFDNEYLGHTWLLDLLPENILLINNPSGIRTVNEKIWAAQFTTLTPPTFIGRKKEPMLDFLSRQEEIIVKPTHAYGGQSIFYLKKGDVNTSVILESVSENFSKDIILQKYIPEADLGDKRILLLNGEPLGAVLRLHQQGEHRNNFFSGGKAVKSVITEQDKKIIDVLSPRLRDLGLYFVGIDVIGDYLIEVNVTSPTCLQEINRLDNCFLEDAVIDFVENEKKGMRSCQN